MLPERRRLRQLAALAGLLCAQACAPAKPNIVFVLADDLGWADVGYHGGAVPTPSIDRLAAEGVKLEALYAFPACTTTRAALLTGRYPMRYGLQRGVIRPWSRQGLPVAERTLAQGLREAGYATAIVGKWHLGHAERAMLPTQRGFDHQYGPYNGWIDYFTHERGGGLDWHRDDQPSHDQGYATTLLGDEAVRLIEQHDFHQPLFLYLAFTAVHSPSQALPEHVKLFESVPDERRRIYYAMIHALDEQLGRVVDAVERRGEMENTLFVFASDNGAPERQAGSNRPLRGGKNDVYEGGARVAAFATWRGRIAPGGRVAEPLHMVDWYPTLLGLAGAAIAQPLPLDGRDAWPAIAQGKPSPRETIFTAAWPRGSALRQGNLKLVLRRASRDAELTAELFDLAQDPSEAHDLAAQQPERVATLRAQLDALDAESVPARFTRKPREVQAPSVWGDESD
jgi:arylsulfatase A-like enzyme